MKDKNQFRQLKVNNFVTKDNYFWNFWWLCEKVFKQQKKAQFNSLVTYLVKPLLSRNFCQKCVRENSRNFHTVRSIQHFHGIFSTKRERTRVKFVIFTVYS